MYIPFIRTLHFRPETWSIHYIYIYVATYMLCVYWTHLYCSIIIHKTILFHCMLLSICLNPIVKCYCLFIINIKGKNNRIFWPLSIHLCYKFLIVHIHWMKISKDSTAILLTITIHYNSMTRFQCLLMHSY